jgi:hypothetical protein
MVPNQPPKAPPLRVAHLAQLLQQHRDGHRTLQLLIGSQDSTYSHAFPLHGTGARNSAGMHESEEG